MLLSAFMLLSAIARGGESQWCNEFSAKSKAKFAQLLATAIDL